MGPTTTTTVPGMGAGGDGASLDLGTLAVVALAILVALAVGYLAADRRWRRLPGLYRKWENPVRGLSLTLIVGGLIAITAGSGLDTPGASGIAAGAVGMSLIYAYDLRKRRERLTPPLGFMDTKSVLQDRAEKPFTAAVVRLYAPGRRPLAKALVTVFQAAMWDVQFDERPPGKMTSVGIIVSGHGPTYVHPLATAFLNDGLTDVTGIIDPGPLPQNETARKAAIQSLVVAIGPETKPRSRWRPHLPRRHRAAS